MLASPPDAVTVPSSVSTPPISKMATCVGPELETPVMVTWFACAEVAGATQTWHGPLLNRGVQALPALEMMEPGSPARVEIATTRKFAAVFG